MYMRVGPELQQSTPERNIYTSLIITDHSSLAFCLSTPDAEFGKAAAAGAWAVPGAADRAPPAVAVAHERHAAGLHFVHHSGEP